MPYILGYLCSSTIQPPKSCPPWFSNSPRSDLLYNRENSKKGKALHPYTHPRIRLYFLFFTNGKVSSDPQTMEPNPGTSSKPPPMFVSQKSSAAPASVDIEQVELRDMIAAGPPPELALKDDVMKLAMHGDEIGLRELLDSGVSADFRDAQGITPLHVWHPLFAVWG